MPSKDTINFHLTKKSRDEIERIRRVISKELGINVEEVTIKQAEIAFKNKSQKGKILECKIRDIMLGKIK